MSMDYIRRYYGVPAKRGGRVKFEGKPGVITGTRGAHLRIRLDGEKRSDIYHPMWHIEYIQPRVWRTGAPEPTESVRVRDNQGDVWKPCGDGLWETPETKPFPWEHVLKKWGPVTEAFGPFKDDDRPHAFVRGRYVPVTDVQLPESEETS